MESLDSNMAKSFEVNSAHNPLLIETWREIQDKLRTQIINRDTAFWQQDFSNLRYIAGLDISTPKDAGSEFTDAFTALVVFSYPDITLVHQQVQSVTLDTPYVPGFLAFRESPAVCLLVKKFLEDNPHLPLDVLLIDGNGILHPQRCGLACHIGLNLNLPVIGVAKNLHHVDGLQVRNKKEVQRLNEPGDYVNLRANTGEILGIALKTSAGCKNPVYVSIGHKICLDTARRVVLAVSRYRVPEPIRVADRISREAIAAQMNSREMID